VLVPGVGKVAIGGAIPQQINIDISLAKMAPAASRSTSFPLFSAA
jgi:multidrug efflux pump subunit AcrB